MAVDLKQLYEIERDKLNSLCDKWQQVLVNGPRRTLNNDVKGEIMAVLGQTQLLLTKKLKQFEKLVTDAKQVIGDMPPIKQNDLEGFWELVMIEVNSVYAKFEDLDKLNLYSLDRPRSVTSKNMPGRKITPSPKFR